MSLARRQRLWKLAIQRSHLLVALGLIVFAVGSLVVNTVHKSEPIILLLIPGTLASIILRRRRPDAALVIAVAVDAATPDNQSLILPVMAALYTIATASPWRRAAAAGAGAGAATIVAGVVRGAGNAVDHGGLLGYAISSTAWCAAAVSAGLYVGARRRIVDALHERAERLDRERALLADRAVAQERIRIAQELHDIIAHNVSLMVVEAQALGASIAEARVTQSTDAIADLGRQAMTEMHMTLRLLRSEQMAPELSPQPGLDQLERLLEQLRRAGLEVELTVTGHPRQLAPGVDLSAFRILQEALTNVVKHAAGARTKVTLAYLQQAIELTIIDIEDQVRAAVPQEISDGHGVIGMRERAALFGGTLHAEASSGGFKVTATLPYVPTAS